MASKAILAKPLLRGIVKAVPSGDTLVIMEMGNTASEIPKERTIILSSLMAPRLARRGGKQATDEPFAWQSREFLRKLCIGKEVRFQIDYTFGPKGLEFGSVFLDNNNIASWVVAQGWAKVKEVREFDKDKGECSPHLKMLRNSANKAMNQGAGLWSKAAGAVRNLPPSAVDDPLEFNPVAFLDRHKGKRMEAIVEYVRDGSTLYVYLLPDYQHVRVFVAGIQAPRMRNSIAEPEKTEVNGKTSNGSRGPLTSAQKVAASSAPTAEAAPNTFERESKHFTELRVLHRDVHIVFEDIDFDRAALIGSVYYPDGEPTEKDLAVQLVANGLAKYVERSAYLLQDNVKRLLKNSELVAKKSRLRIWNNYMPPPSNSKAIIDQNFTGKVVEVVSGDCIVVKDDSLQLASSAAAGRRVYLSSIRCPGLVAREARQVLKKHLDGHQVHVSMEYSRKVNKEREMEFGSVYLESQSESADDAPSTLPTAAGSQHHRTNIAEMMVARGFAEVIRHRDFEVRSNHYDALLDAECHAKAAKEGMHSDKKNVDRQAVSNGHPARYGPAKNATIKREPRQAVSNGQPARYGPAKNATIKREPKEKLQIRENHVKGQEVSSSQEIKKTSKEVLQVVAKEVLGGGRFYVQTAADQKSASIIQQKLASLRLQEAPAIGSYNPKKGDLVIAQFSQDNSWYRAMIVDAPKGAVRSAKAKFEVFYIDYGTQEFVPYSRLRPSDCYSLPSSSGLAKLCSLAHVKVPGWEEDYGKEAACRLSDYILHGRQKEFKAIVEERDNSGGEVRGYATGTNHIVTLMDTEAGISINAVMLKEGLARLDEREQEDEAVKQTIAGLKAYQNEARKGRLGMWKNGYDISDNDEDEKSSA